MPATSPRKDQRLEFRIAGDDRDLLVRAADASGLSLSSFANEELRTAARRVLADRSVFALDAGQQAVWDAIMERPARDVQGLRELLDRPSPFADAQ